MGKQRTDIIERKEEILQWISENQPNAEIARRLNCKVDTLKSYYKKMGIEYSGNQGGKGNVDDNSYRPASYYFDNQHRITASKLRVKLFRDKIKEEKCECCGLSEWMGKPIPLELHHIDFNHYNNELGNLQILCSNCHMQAHNYNNNKED